MNTIRLFDADSHQTEFESEVLSCEPDGAFWRITLRETLFFPESGGQPADSGQLGGVRIRNAEEREGVIVHCADQPLRVGSRVAGKIDWPLRFRRMQNHSGEHILSGLVWQIYGFHNVGFHLKDGEMTVDFDGELSPESLRQLEIEANLAIARNGRVTARYPNPAELAELEYRSKLDLKENVRLVEIEGTDRCACCAPHVFRTGEIGILKILDSMRHRGGTRLSVLCGLDALADYGTRLRTLKRAGELLSLPSVEVPDGVSRLIAERDGLRLQLSRSEQLRLEAEIRALTDRPGNVCFFTASEDETAVRKAVNGLTEGRSGIAAGFFGAGDVKRCILGSRTRDLRAISGDFFKRLNGRGGGSPEMIRGTVRASEDEIRAALAALEQEGVPE